MQESLLNFSAAFPKSFNREFQKFMDGVGYSEYLPLGIYQFYPDWVKVIDGQMHVFGECGTEIILGKVESGKCYEKYFRDVINKDACV